MKNNDIRPRIFSGFMAATVAMCTLPFFIVPTPAEAAVLSSNALVSEEDTRDAGYSWERSFRNEILDACEKLDGVKYEWGGSGSNGIDCAGSVSLAYSAALGTVWIDETPGDYGERTVVYYGGGDPDEYGFYWPGYAGIKTSFTNGLLDIRGITPVENHFSDFEYNGTSGIQSDEWIDIIKSHGFKPGDMIMWWNDDNDDENAQHITIYAGIEDGVPMHWTASSTAGYFCKKPLADSSAEAGKGSFSGFYGLKATDLHEEPYVGFYLDKTDDSGISYTGCVFSVYSDSSLENKVGELTDENQDGIYTDYRSLRGVENYDDRYLLTRISDIGPSYEDTLYVKETKGPDGVILPDGTTLELDDSGVVPDVYNYMDPDAYILNISLSDPDGTYGYLEYSLRREDGTYIFYDYVSNYSYLQGSDVIVITNKDDGSGTFSDAGSLRLEKTTSTGIDTTSTVFTVLEGTDTVATYKYAGGSWNWYDSYGRMWNSDTFPVKYDTDYTILETFSSNESFKCVDGSVIEYLISNDTDGWTRVNDTTYKYDFSTGTAVSGTYGFTVENNKDTGKIKAVKNVSDEDDTREGFVFELWNENKTKKLANGSSSEDGTIYWDTGSGKHLETFNVPVGKYFLVEYAPHKSYADSSDEYTYKVPEGFYDGLDGKWYKEITVGFELQVENIINDRTEGSLKIIKTAEDGIIENVEFSLYSGGNDEEPDWNDKAIVSGKTDSDGVLEFKNLPIGWYRIEETVKPAYSPKWDDGSKGSSRTVRITEEDDNKVIEISVDNTIDITPSVSTELTDYGMSHDIGCGGSVKVKDVVYFENLTSGYDYTVTGSLVDKNSGEILKDREGNDYVVSVEFTADASIGTASFDSQGREVISGHVEVPFEIDSAYLFEQKFASGEESLGIVCIETLKFRGITVAEHYDLEDEKQTVRVAPVIRTAASDRSTGTGVLAYSEVVDIDDKISFKGLVPGESYVVTGTLMDKSTGKPYADAAGKTYTVEQTFIGSETGFVIVHFNKVNVPYGTAELVVFESIRLEKGDKEIAVHKDINDKDQTLRRPSCITYAATVSGNKAFLKDPEVTVVDKIYYEKLEAGHAYYAKATLSLSDGTKVLCNGYEVTSLQEFVPEKESGLVEVTIRFDASELKPGDTVVVFENIYDRSTEEEVARGIQTEDVKVVSHEDLNNKDQSLNVTEITQTGEQIDYTKVGLAVMLITAGGALILVTLCFRRKKFGRE